MFNIEDARVYTIKDIQKYTKDHNVKMLSEYTADFWAGYRANYQRFDRLFMKRFTSWYPFDQDPEETLESIQQDFTYDVYAHLMANDKRYSELWRVNVIPDNDAYSLTNNVDYTETYEETNGQDTDFTKGQELDSETLSKTKGQQIDSEDLSRTKGQQIDSEDLSTTIGAQNEDTTNSTSAYNSSVFKEVDKTEVDKTAHTDTQDNERTYGSRTDTEYNSSTYGSRTDSENNSRTYGQRKDITKETGSKDYELHKVGNMGVQTVDDMLLKHWDNWTMFDFYGFVFDEIARDLLRGC